MRNPTAPLGVANYASSTASKSTCTSSRRHKDAHSRDSKGLPKVALKYHPDKNPDDPRAAESQERSRMPMKCSRIRETQGVRLRRLRVCVPRISRLRIQRGDIDFANLCDRSAAAYNGNDRRSPAAGFAVVLPLSFIERPRWPARSRSASSDACSDCLGQDRPVEASETCPNCHAAAKSVAKESSKAGFFLSVRLVLGGSGRKRRPARVWRRGRIERRRRISIKIHRVSMPARRSCAQQGNGPVAIQGRSNNRSHIQLIILDVRQKYPQ